MGRLLDWPFGPGLVSMAPLTGPRTMGSASNESMTGFVQTSSSPFGLWRWQLAFNAMRGLFFRLYRGMVVGLHGGANAVRVPFYDPDLMGIQESGVDATDEEIRAGTPWSNGTSWSNGANWSVTRPWVGVRVNKAKGSTDIRLEPSEYWGADLQGGEWIGFVPFHFGLYIVTEVQGGGDYKIWPPLRKDITTSDWATLHPVMAMRLESESAGTATRGLVVAEGNTMTLIEVEDADVREYFDEEAA